jgi:hypothetical protein
MEKEMFIKQEEKKVRWLFLKRIHKGVFYWLWGVCFAITRNVDHKFEKYSNKHWPRKNGKINLRDIRT